MKAKPIITTVDEYILSFPRDVQKKLTQLRNIVKRGAPQAEERISYQMPAFFLKGVLLWYGAHSNHIGFYPRAEGISRFKRELSGFKYAKGSVQFPLNQPLPVELIKRMVKYRVDENLKKSKKKIWM